MKAWLGVSLLVLPAWAQAQAVDCEALRTQIEARIRANGVAQPQVRVVEAAASAAGRVVGSCERGAKKIVYTASATAAGASAPAAPRRASVITECADGRVITEGSCRKP
jgi:hypothetical protein